MANSFIPYGLALLVTMQVATGGLDAETKRQDAGTKTLERPVDVKGAEDKSPRPSGSEPAPQRPEGRRPRLPRLLRRDAADEAPGIDKPAPRERAHVATGERKTVIIRLGHVPAIDTAETMSRWLESEENVTGQAAANVVAVAVTNDLVVSGSPEQLETIQAVVSELDRPKPQIHVKAMLVDMALSEAPKALTDQPSIDVSEGDFSEIVARLKERGDLRVLAQPQLLCADNQPAFLQYGSRVPRVTGANTSPRSRARTVTLENVGTMFGVTCRVSEDDLVTMEIDLERSHLGPDDEGTAVATADDGSIVRSPEVKTLTLQTTVSLRSGQTVALGGMVYQTEERRGQLLLVLQPKIVPPSAGQ